MHSRFIQTLRRIFKPIVFYFYKDLHTKTFLLDGTSYHYYTKGSYNNPWKNERAVEVAIGLDLLKKYKNKNVLEVGNVLSNYVRVNHDVVDPYDSEPFVIKEDIVTYTAKKKYDLIICLSTLEHIGWDMGDGVTGRDGTKPLKALTHMKNLLAKNGKLVVTVPLGYNSYIDEYVLEGTLPLRKTLFLKRTSLLNYWKEVKTVSKKDMNYGAIIMSAKTLLVGIV